MPVSKPVVMNVPMAEKLRKAISKLRKELGLRSDAAAVRVAIQALCREHEIPVPEDVIGPGPGQPRKKTPSE